MADHRQAAVAALTADPNLLVYDGVAPVGSQPPYVAVYVYSPAERRMTLTGPTDYTNVIVITHSIGYTVEAAWIVSQAVRSVLLDTRLAVTGALCSRIEHALGQPPVYDEATGVLVVDVMDEWDYYAIPA